jgi:hypothetical protein
LPDISFPRVVPFVYHCRFIREFSLCIFHIVLFHNIGDDCQGKCRLKNYECNKKEEGFRKKLHRSLPLHGFRSDDQADDLIGVGFLGHELRNFDSSSHYYEPVCNGKYIVKLMADNDYPQTVGF